MAHAECDDLEERVNRVESELWTKLDAIQISMVEIQTGMATIIAKTENYPARMHDLEKRQNTQGIEIASIKPIMKAAVWLSGLTLTVLAGVIATYAVNNL